MDVGELDKRFTYHAPQAGQVPRYEEIRQGAKVIAEMWVDLCPESRELSVALTHLETAVMWANAAIARRE